MLRSDLRSRRCRRERLPRGVILKWPRRPKDLTKNTSVIIDKGERFLAPLGMTMLGLVTKLV